MIKGAIEYIIGLGQKGDIVDVHGRKYGSRNLTLIKEPSVTQVNIHNLSGVVDFIKSKIDDPHVGNENSPWLIVIESPTCVYLTTKASTVTCERETYISCTALLPRIHFEQFMEAEPFNIQLQSTFVDVGDRAAVLRIIGNIVEEEVQNATDDGVTQKIVARKGVSLAVNLKVPNPVNLAPYRTFSEIDQPISPFVLRLQNGPRCALFEADGGAWKPAAMESIKNYFLHKLGDLVKENTVLIIS